MNKRYKDELHTEHRLFRANYTITNTTIEIGKADIQVVQQHSFEFFANRMLKPRHLTSGLGVAGICLGAYFLEKKFGLISRVLGRGSVIYEVTVPTASYSTFEKLVRSRLLEEELRKMFENLEETLKELGCKDVVAELDGSDKFEELKKIRLKSLEL